MEKVTECSSAPTPSRIYKEGLSEWAKGIIDAALDSGLKVMDYDGVLQPQIYLFPFGTWHRPPFMEIAGKEVYVRLPHNSEGHGLHFRLESSVWSYPNPDDAKESVTLFFYAPTPLVRKQGVVHGHVVDVWVEREPEGLAPIETP